MIVTNNRIANKIYKLVVKDMCASNYIKSKDYKFIVNNIYLQNILKINNVNK